MTYEEILKIKHLREVTFCMVEESPDGIECTKNRFGNRTMECCKNIEFEKIELVKIDSNVPDMRKEYYGRNLWVILKLKDCFQTEEKMVYREFMDLTDDEIKYIIKDIFPYTSKIDNIIRDPQFNQISCDIYIMEEYPDIPDTLDLMDPAFGEEGITTHDFSLTDKELWKWKQFLLAKGCDKRLKDNPYLAFNETDI